AFHDRTQATRASLALDCLTRDRAKRIFVNRQIDIFHVEQALILLHERILGLDQDAFQRVLVEILERRYHRQTADEFRDQAVLQKVFRLDMTEHFTGFAIFRRADFRGETDRGALAARGDDLFEAAKSAAADEQDVRRVDLQEFLLRMLAPALR